jgi:hypothetical protein
LLLRLAIAAHRLGGPQAVRWAQAYEERLRAAERRHDYSHQREQAMYLLEVRNDPAAALEAARRNWAVQREPADLRLYARAAVAAHAGVDCALIAHWLAQSRYEDRTLGGLLDPRAPAEAR